MLGVTVFGLFLTPVFYVVMRKLGATIPDHPSSVPAHEVESLTHG